jgi:RNA polymerase sigma-70 factor (ECF subfamily)
VTNAIPGAIAITRAVEAVMRKDRGRLLSALTARLKDLQLAEDALQEAMIAALSHWGRSGLPQSPQGWLLRVAMRKAIDRLRGAARQGRSTADLALLAGEEASDMEVDQIPDERLRLIFTCCHPALDRKSHVALTLRVIGGLTTEEIAAAFLDLPATIGQRISRAKARIGAKGIAFAVPGPDQWPERLSSVLATVYLIFTAGYTQGGSRDLGDEAVFLAELLNALRPGEPEIEGCLALLLMTHARRRARVGADGATVPPSEQDRSLWDHAAISRGKAVLEAAIARGAPGPYQIKAAIAALHAAEGAADWPQIAALYAALYRHEPTPVVALNHAVALAEVGQAAPALMLLDALGAALDGHQPFHAARALVLTRLHDHGAAMAAFERAIALAPTRADAMLLERRKKEAEQKPGPSPTGR